MLTQHYTLLYILSAGHCGSTLLDLLMNGHSHILGLGELVTLKRYVAVAQQASGNLVPASLALHRRKPLKDWLEVASHPLDTPFWQSVKHCYEYTSGSAFAHIDTYHPKWSILRSWSPEDIARWVQPQATLLSCLHELSGTSILTDTSKSPHRLYLLQRSGLFNIKVIHLIRNGHAVINSYIRKYGSFGGGLRRWAAPTLLALYLRRKFAQSDWCQVRYEDLAARPETTLKNICGFLGVSFQPEMLAYRSHPYIGIGGNRMREQKDESIVLDEGWKHTLSLQHRLAFTLIASWLNKLYGY